MTVAATASASPTASVATTATATAVADMAQAPRRQRARRRPLPSPHRARAGGPSITIDAVGDISLAREVVDRMQANGADYPYALVAPLLDGDIGFANLEGALTSRGEPWPKGVQLPHAAVVRVGAAPRGHSTS